MRIALVTCEEIPAGVTDIDAELVEPILSKRGAEVETPAWTDPDVDWSGFDLVKLSSTWDYHERPDDFRDWLRRAGEATDLHNPAELVLWNMDKRYLRELEAKGLPVVPTIWSEPPGGGKSDDRAAEMRRDAGIELESEAVARGWGRAIVKPAVDLGAMRLRRVPATGIAAALAELNEPALVQPFLPSLQEEGELSIIFLGGEPAHSILKRPAGEDFRVQEHYGGQFEPVSPPPEALDLARSVMATLDAPPLYGRVDMVRDLEGTLCVIELELIEPSLYLHHADDEMVRRLADVLLERAG